MIRRLLLVLVCSLSLRGFSYTTGTTNIAEQIDLIYDALKTFNTTIGQILHHTSSFQDDYEFVNEDYVIPLCDYVMTQLPEIAVDIQQLRRSIGDYLGDDVFSIRSYVETIDDIVASTYSTLSDTLAEVLLIMDKLTELGDWGQMITETVLTISENIDDDILRNQERIISLLQDIGTMLNWGSDLQSMAEDMAYIRQILDSAIGFIEDKLRNIEWYQGELYEDFTSPWKNSKIPSYTFEFFLPETALESPTSPADWQINSITLQGGESPLGVIDDISVTLRNMLEGDSRASLMLATLVKSLAHENIDPQEKKDEFSSIVSTPWEAAKQEYQEHFGTTDGNGAVQVTSWWQLAIRDEDFERVADLSEFQQSLQQFVIDDFPRVNLSFRLNSIPGLNSVSSEIPIHSFAWFFSACRVIMGCIYWLMFFTIVFFSAKLCYLGYSFLIKFYSTAVQ